jgi:hypothetical protein
LFGGGAPTHYIAASCMSGIACAEKSASPLPLPLYINIARNISPAIWLRAFIDTFLFVVVSFVF